MRTIWLIVESDDDFDVMQQIARKRNLEISVKRKKTTGNTGGVSRLAAQLPRLYQEILEEKQPGDCAAVLHDTDSATDTSREPYEKIQKFCEQNNLIRLTANKMLESWLLADEGLCDWLGIKVQNWDEQRDPKSTLNQKLSAAGKKRFEGRGVDEVIKHLQGNGDKKSPSMREAMRKFQEAACVGSE